MHVPKQSIKLEVQATQDIAKNNYIMDMYGYPQDIPVTMKLLNIYIPESGKNINFRKIPGKEHTGVTFTQTQYKDEKNK